jgi:hypothetical protein
MVFTGEFEIIWKKLEEILFGENHPEKIWRK